MKGWVRKVASYVHQGGHVLMRVTPRFGGSNLVASGVQMEPIPWKTSASR